MSGSIPDAALLLSRVIPPRITQFVNASLEAGCADVLARWFLTMPDSYWFKISPEKYLAIAGRIPDGTQRAEFLAICMHCLATQGGLPDDDEEIAFITAISIERIVALRPYLNRLCSRENGQIIPAVAEETINERQEYSAKKAEAGQKGGKQKQAVLSSAKQKVAVLDSAQAKPSQTNKQTDKQTDKQTVVEELPHETSPENDTNATTTICDGIAETIRSYLNIPETAGWKTQGDVKSIALELADLGATAAQVAEFIKTRQKPPGKAYWSQDFLKWRASQPASAPTERKITKAPADYLKLYEGGKKSA